MFLIQALSISGLIYLFHKMYKLYRSFYTDYETPPQTRMAKAGLYISGIFICAGMLTA